MTTSVDAHAEEPPPAAAVTRPRVFVTGILGVNAPTGHQGATIGVRVHRSVLIEAGAGSDDAGAQYAVMGRLRPSVGTGPSFGLGVSHGPYADSTGDSRQFQLDTHTTSDSMTFANLEFALHVPAGPFFEFRVALGARIGVSGACETFDFRSRDGDSVGCTATDLGDVYGSVGVSFGL